MGHKFLHLPHRKKFSGTKMVKSKIDYAQQACTECSKKLGHTVNTLQEECCAVNVLQCTLLSSIMMNLLLTDISCFFRHFFMCLYHSVTFLKKEIQLIHVHTNRTVCFSAFQCSNFRLKIFILCKVMLIYK